jgi:hypothetical protein
MSVLTAVGPDLLADGLADELARVGFLLPRSHDVAGGVFRRSRSSAARRASSLWSSKLAILQAG